MYALSSPLKVCGSGGKCISFMCFSLWSEVVPRQDVDANPSRFPSALACCAESSYSEGIAALLESLCIIGSLLVHPMSTKWTQQKIKVFEKQVRTAGMPTREWFSPHDVALDVTDRPPNTGRTLKPELLKELIEVSDKIGTTKMPPVTGKNTAPCGDTENFSVSSLPSPRPPFSWLAQAARPP